MKETLTQLLKKEYHEETLNEYFDRVANFRTNLRSLPITREELRAEQNELRNVSETLTLIEAKLLLYIRKANNLKLHEFLCAAEKNLSAFQAFENLTIDIPLEAIQAMEVPYVKS